MPYPVLSPILMAPIMVAQDGRGSWVRDRLGMPVPEIAVRMSTARHATLNRAGSSRGLASIAGLP